MEKFNEAKGNKCIHCKRAILVGLNMEGHGMVHTRPPSASYCLMSVPLMNHDSHHQVHKGFCHSQILREQEEERKLVRCLPKLAHTHTRTCSHSHTRLNPALMQILPLPAAAAATAATVAAAAAFCSPDN